MSDEERSKGNDLKGRDDYIIYYGLLIFCCQNVATHKDAIQTFYINNFHNFL